MTRRFRLGLFVSLAAAVGLHVRPCMFSLVHGDEPACDACRIPSASIAPRAVDSAPVGIPVHVRSTRVTASRIPSSARPALASLCDAPAFIGFGTTIADGR